MRPHLESKRGYPKGQPLFHMAVNESLAN